MSGATADSTGNSLLLFIFVLSMTTICYSCYYIDVNATTIKIICSLGFCYSD
jgi:hypothetical protein